MQKRIIFSIVFSTLTILISLGIISYFSVSDSIKRSLKNRLALSNMISKYIDYILEDNLTRLYDISLPGRIDFEDNDWEPEKKALKNAYEYSIFTDRIFLLDLHGNVVLTYPHSEGGLINLSSIPYVSRALSEKKQIISDVYTIDSINKKVIFTLVPLRDKNSEIIGVAGGEINPTSYKFIQIIKSLPIEPNTYIELVDSYGTIIASSDQKRILTSSDHNRYLGNLIANKQSSVSTCHRCHLEGDKKTEITEDIIAFSPLSFAPWGILIRESEEEVFLPAKKIRKSYIILGLIFLTTALMLAIGISRSIVRPIQLLINATKKIGKGNLSEPVNINSRDEIGTLANSFENMRIQLAESLDKIQIYNIELENRVAERTKELELSRKKLSNMLRQVITAQEQERKRVARELHDETSQSLNVMLMHLDAQIISLKGNFSAKANIKQLRDHVMRTLNGVHQIIKDLRPPVLDDLGLESAVRWILERHLGEKGIKFFFSVKRSCKETKDFTVRITDCLEVELILFRIIQEAIINIDKHADADNVCVSLIFHDAYVEIEIEDDGKGFDAKKLFESLSSGKNINRFGLLGMQERIALLNGKLTVCSRPDEGTQLSIFVPY